jgi:hypothetical protein
MMISRLVTWSVSDWTLVTISLATHLADTLSFKMVPFCENREFFLIARDNYVRVRLMGYLHNMTDFSENCVVQGFQMSYDKNRTDHGKFCLTTQSVGLCK